METEMGLTLEELNQIIRVVSLHAVTVIDDEYYEWPKEKIDALIAAARAHLERQEWLSKEMAWRSLPQPQQQREDDGPDTRIRNRGADRPVCDLDVASNVAPAPSSTVEPLPIHKTVWRESVKPILDALTERSQKEWECSEHNPANYPPSPSPDTNFSKRKSEDAGLVERLRHIDSLSPVKSIFGAAAAALEAKDADKAQGIAMINELATMCNELKATIEAKDAEIGRLRELLKGCLQTDTLPRAVEMEIEDALALPEKQGWWAKHWASGEAL
jgi:hypothetical protein